MNKFDLVYEQIRFSLNEELRYANSTLVDYVGLLVLALKKQDYIEGEIDNIVKRVMNQKQDVKMLAITKEGLPPLKIEMSSSQDDKFIVTVINMEDEEDQQTFESSLSTNCIEDVLAYVREKRVQELEPENAVEEMPPGEGGEAQPGNQGSALPGMAAPEQAPPAPPAN